MTTPIVTLYDDAGRLAGSWSAITACDLAFGEHGPEQATVVVPKRTTAGALNPELNHRVVMPGGRGALVEIDARENGVDDVFLGRLRSMSDANDAASVSFAVEGPHSWLDAVPIPAQSQRRVSPGRIIAELVKMHGGRLRLRPGVFHDGIGVDVDLNGGSFWSIAATLESLTNDRLYMTADPGAARLVADWRSQVSRQHDRRGVQLLEGVNVNWSADANLDPAPAELVLVGQSFGQGPGVQANTMRAPAGPLYGRMAALTATLYGGPAAAAGGITQGFTTLRPDLATRAALETAARAQLQRGLVAPIMAQLVVTDLDNLYGEVRVGDIVTVALTTHALGLFTNATAQIQAIAYGVVPAKSMTMTAELWATL